MTDIPNLNDWFVIQQRFTNIRADEKHKIKVIAK